MFIIGQEEQARYLLHNFEDLLQGKPGITNVVENAIRMVNEKPVQVINEQKPYKIEERINKEVSEMLQMNIIEPSVSPICLLVFIVAKKDGLNRFCVDYKLLKSQINFYSEPMPDSDEMFLKFAWHKFFSKIGL